MSRRPAELAAAVQSVEQPGQLADLVASLLDLAPGEKQEILETVPLLARLDRVLWRLAYRLEVLRLSADIGKRTRATMEGRQREFMLREQLKAIQKELGEDEGTSPELADLKRALDEAGLPDEVAKQAQRELRRLERMQEGGPESGMVRTYLEWLSELPWRLGEEPGIDIAEARRVLDEDHYALEKIKRRILEFLAVRKLNPDGRGPILCFVGPPGVGKTSLGQSIARATGRPFVRVSLGGVHDESEIRGHRRTYIGALPGNIIQAIRRAGSRSLRDDAGRDRQARRRRLPGRPVIGAAGSAGPGAERHVPRRLSGRAVRPQPRAVHRDRATRWTRSRPRSGTAWR